MVILALQSTLSVALLHNTIFQDEGLYLYAGRQLLREWTGGPVSLDHYAYYISGYPGVYPAIGGLLDLIGGLELARAFSLACMLGVTSIVYFLAARLFGRSAAIYGSSLYALSGVVLFLGRLATFDALCLLLLASTTTVCVLAGTGRRSGVALLFGPLMVLAILAKYAAMLFVPALLALVVCGGLVTLGARRTLTRLALAIASLAVSLGVAYLMIDKAAFHAISGSTTHRTALLAKPRLDLLAHVLQMGGVLFALATVALFLVSANRRQLRSTAIVFYLAAWLMPAYHIYKHEAISIDKHIAFGLFFAAPLAGYALATLAEGARPGTQRRPQYWIGSVAVVVLVCTLGLHQSQQLFATWANTSELSYALHTQFRNGAGRILSEDIEVSRYDTEDITQQWQWNGVNYFYYKNSSKEYFGNSALIQALRDRYFAFVELSFNAYPGQALFIAQQMAMTANYDLIAIIPFRNSFGTGHYYLWRSATVAGRGDFTSMSQIATCVDPTGPRDVRRCNRLEAAHPV